ncbi:MAG: hypothetical protein M3R49_06860 [Chloroflexota bacterium]|nr:hypothetical protein [Chloroflexota bacterium]
MSVPIDEATSRFLKSAGADLQSRLGKVGTVEELKIDDGSSGVVSLVTRVRVGSRTVDYRATGDNLVEAYAALTHGITTKNESSATNRG